LSQIKKITPFFISTLLMYVILGVIFPHYRYYIDPDGTAYLTISQRYAVGDFYKAINGLWSPFGCWITAFFIKAGFVVIDASWIANTLGATGFLFISHSIFLHFEIKQKSQWLMDITLAIFLCSSIFWQSFDDLWSCFFALASLRIMLAKDFTSKPALWVVCGLMGTLAYLSKAYFFPFFLLNMVCCTYFIAKGNKAQWLRISAFAIAAMVIFSMPWIWALHYKYGIWAASTSGSMNMSWYLVGHPYWKDNIAALLPPSYKDSPSYWEDPWFANGRMYHMWDSLSWFGLQLLRIGYNVYKFIYCLLQISVFFPVVLVLSLFIVLSKKIRGQFTNDTFIVALSSLLLPSGLFMNHFESRFLWYMLPLGALLAVLALQNKANWKRIFMPLLALSILIFPLWCMKKMYNEGINEYMISQQLKQMNIHGTFTGTPKPGRESQRLQRIAYFSGIQYYNPVNPDVTTTAALKDMRRYNINYYFTYDTAKFVDEQGKPFEQINTNYTGALKVFKIYP